MIEIVLLPVLTYYDQSVVWGMARKQPSLSACVERLANIEEMPLPKGVKEVRWTCMITVIQGRDV